REDDDNAQAIERLSLTGTAWVTTLDLTIHPAQVRKKVEDKPFAFLGSTEEMDGETELYRVGRCLNQLYPDDLDRVLLRDREIAELTRLLNASDRRPLLLLGPR